MVHESDKPATPVTPAPLSAYVDYTPRRTFMANQPDPLDRYGIKVSRQSRAYYFHQLAQQQNGDDYMDSPQVRRYHGISSEVAPIEPVPTLPIIEPRV